MQQELLWPEPHKAELPAMKKGGGQETSSPSHTFAAGKTVAGDPEEGAPSHEEVGGGGHSTMAAPKNILLSPLPGL
ncbi:UNVERIFIED_CONTAM: hypothetical protein FKN15_077068 [Acipenser sinensis]